MFLFLQFCRIKFVKLKIVYSRYLPISRNKITRRKRKISSPISLYLSFISLDNARCHHIRVTAILMFDLLRNIHVPRCSILICIWYLLVNTLQQISFSHFNRFVRMLINRSQSPMFRVVLTCGSRPHGEWWHQSRN